MKGDLLPRQLPMVALTVHPFMMGCRRWRQVSQRLDPLENALRVIGVQAVGFPFAA
jgi:hypothetical protein